MAKCHIWLVEQRGYYGNDSFEETEIFGLAANRVVEEVLGGAEIVGSRPPDDFWAGLPNALHLGRRQKRKPSPVPKLPAMFV